MSGIRPLLATALATALLSSCGPAAQDIEDGENDVFGGGKDDGWVEGSPAALAVLALVNDPAVTATELDMEAGMSARVAASIVAHRDGADRAAGTADDDLFDTLLELDRIPYVGPKALEALIAYAQAQGYPKQGSARISVVFSPQPPGQTHTAKVAELVREAQYSVDIAMYSYSDAEVGAALEDAVQRGVKVRFLFDLAGDDGRTANPAATKSGRLEAKGIDVRGVNKILHHKFAILDGPRDVAERAATARLVTGSANWSFGGAQTYDENTLFIENSAELATAYQREFDLLWAHSRDFALATPLPYELSTADLPEPTDDASLAALFTTANFSVTDGSTTFRVDKSRTAVADALALAIANARSSIWVAHGHMRMRPVAEALIAAKQARPDLDVRVYLDQQEYISASADTTQRTEVEACLAAAGADPLAQRDCLDSDYYFSKALVEAGITLRYKSFAYRWNATYAVQMHHKYMIVDGTDLYTGSYNLSTNSEQGTFENVVHLRGAAHAATIDAYEANFEAMWVTGAGLLDPLRQTISTASSIPLVFPPMALTYDEFTALRALIRANCSVVDSDEYRSNPAAHRTCPR